MGIFSKLFGKKGKDESAEQPLEFKQAVDFNTKFFDLLKADTFIARSDYKHLTQEYQSTATFFENGKRAQTLTYYCRQNKVSQEEINKFLASYEDIIDLSKGSSIVDIHNEEYIQKHLLSEKSYLDNVLKEIDPKILLDEEQRRVILSDEDYSLVIAGAGAGKTTTVAAKVRYLVEKKKIDPKQILVISFTNKAVGELKERINEGLLLPCPITTFHSAGYAILRKQDDLKRQIVGDGFLYNTVNNYLKGNILEQPELVDKLIMFFGSYFDAPYDGNDINLFFNYISKTDFSTLKSNINEYNEQIIDRRTSKITTITNETLRSAQEVQIANYLYLHKIDYVYEDPYPYHILKAKKPYTPDFRIKQGNKIAYIEHFGITEDGKNSRYTTEQLEKYKKEIVDKIALHKKHGTTLIYTFSKYKDGRDLLDHLQEELTNNGFVLEKRPSEAEDEYLLSLKLFCGKCGAHMVGESGTGTSRVYRYYKCANTKKVHICDKKPVRKEWIEDLTVKIALDILKNDEIKDYLTDRIYALQGEENPRMPKLKAQLADVEKRLANIMQAIEQGIIFDTTKERFAALEKEKKELEITILQEKIKKPFLTKEQIRFGIEKFGELDISTKEGKQRLIDGFINAIYVYDDKITFAFNYKDGTRTVMLSELSDGKNNSDLKCQGAPNEKDKVFFVFFVCVEYEITCEPVRAFGQSPP